MELIKLYCPTCNVDFLIPRTPDNESKEHIHEYCNTKMVKYNSESTEQEGKDNIKNIERALELRKELFYIANSYAGDITGYVAVTLHEACNKIVEAKEILQQIKEQ